MSVCAQEAECTLRTADQTVDLPTAWPELRQLGLLTMRWLRRHGSALLKRPTARRLRVAETVSLGEKRFVSIIEVDGEQFLLGGSGSAVTLLAKLESSQRTPQQAQRCSFGDVYSQLCTQEYDANGSANRVGELPK